MIELRERRLNEDMTYKTKNADGTKTKKKVTDPNTGTKYEKYGHLSDCLDYAICLMLQEEFHKYQRQSLPAATTCSGDTVYGNFNY